MQIRVIGIFILLSLLLIRSGGVMAAYADRSALAVETFDSSQLPATSDNDELPAELPENQDEPKQTELADEECLPVALIFADYVPFSFKIQSYIFANITKIHSTLPYPPPELIS